MKKSLLLNADFSPFKLIGWQKALIQIIVDSKDSAYAVEYYEEWVILDSSGRKYQVPAVIALKKYVDVSNQSAPYTKSNIYARDNMTCQYCGLKFKKQDLTIDHVIPKSRFNQIGKGKVSSFENVVTSCRLCNSKKGNKTLKEVNMALLTTPRSISRREAFLYKLNLEHTIPKEWNPYLK